MFLLYKINLEPEIYTCLCEIGQCNETSPYYNIRSEFGEAGWAALLKKLGYTPNMEEEEGVTLDNYGEESSSYEPKYSSSSESDSGSSSESKSGSSESKSGSSSESKSGSSSDSTTSSYSSESTSSPTIFELISTSSASESRPESTQEGVVVHVVKRDVIGYDFQDEPLGMKIKELCSIDR